MLISPIRRLVETTIDLGWKIVSGGLVWWGSKKVNDKLEELEKDYYPQEEEQIKPARRKHEKRKSAK